MSHPLGDLLSQHLHRKHGLSQAKLAAGILQDPSIIGKMCKGRRLNGPQARERVCAIIDWLRQQAVMVTVSEANQLLAAAGMAVLRADEPVEQALLQQLAAPPTSSYKPITPYNPVTTTSRPTNLSASHSNGVGRAPALSAVAQHATTASFRQESPDFLPNNSLAPAQHVAFVARENELAHLERQLDQMLAGHGLVSFVIGEAGSGKTSLLREIGQRALARDATLVVATGNCNAYGGLGDPYLPFREIMALLTGDVEAGLRAGVISGDHASRLRRLTLDMAQALIQHGASLIEIFLAGAALYARASAAVTGDLPWLAQLEALVAQSGTRQPPLDIGQTALFAMYTRVLQAVAQRHPLILMVEDLHWADSGSISLLFHLGHHLAGQRVWVLGTYRPHDLAMPRTATTTGAVERHPLEALVHEFQRLFGEKPLDLGQSDGQQFVESILNLEKHQLPVTFRTSLFHHTQGHALFTTEILRDMKLRADLVRDQTGDWIIGNAIDWAQVPSRVEGVISARINRLPSQLLEIVKVASVMGEEFIAEVVASVLHQDERTVVHQLGARLDRRHDLVHSQGNLHLGEQRLSHYRFRHILFQHYLYQTLDEGERAYLHEDIGQTLEQFYQGQTAQVAVQLARHFQAAGLTSKAVAYLQQAAAQADARLAFREAADLCNDALRLLETLPKTAERQRQQARLQLALAPAQFKTGELTQSLHSFQRAAEIAYAHQWVDELAQAGLGYEQVRYRFNRPAAPAIRILENALELIGATDSVLKARILGQLAQAFFFNAAAEQAETLSLQAIAMARQVDDPLALFDALYVRAIAYRKPENIQARLVADQELLQLARLLGDREREAHVYTMSVADYLEAGDIAAVDRMLAAHAQFSDELQQAFLFFVFHVAQSMRAALAGNFTEAEAFAQRALMSGQQMQVEVANGTYGILMFTLHREQGGISQLASSIEEYVERNPDSVWRPGLALIYCDLGWVVKAREQFALLAANNFTTLSQDALWVGSLAYLSEVCVFLQDRPRAAQLYQYLLPYADVVVVIGFGVACLGAAAHYLALLATVLEQWANAETLFEKALRLNAQIKSRPRLAHTQVQYAALRLARNQPGDRARAIVLLNEAVGTIEACGMKFLAAKVEAIRQQYFSR